MTTSKQTNPARTGDEPVLSQGLFDLDVQGSPAAQIPETEGGRPLPRGFLKWAGGKGQLLPKILPRLPERIVTYFEPFVGSGAVFWALAREQRFERAVLSDMNAELITTYRAIRDDVEEIIAFLASWSHSETFYYELRARDPEAMAPAEAAARMIHLNHTGFNGLYRVNKSGRFNVPYGRYKRPRTLNQPVLRAASRALQGVNLLVADFADVLSTARPGDAVYFDPPYVPMSNTASFTAYEKSGFGEAAQRRLVLSLEELRDRGVHALLSNSDVPLTRELYQGLRCETVQARRAINSRADKRGPVSELLVSI